MLKALYVGYVVLTLCSRRVRRIVFVSGAAPSLNCWYLYKYLVRHRPAYEFVWLVDRANGATDKRILAEAEHSNVRVRCLPRGSIAALWNVINSCMVFTTGNVYSFVGKTIRGPTIVNLWHGMPIKKIGWLEVALPVGFYGDFTVATSEFYRNVMSRAFRIPEGRVLPSGLPRNDVLRLGAACDTDSTLRKLEIPVGKALIFWLPTFRRMEMAGLVHHTTRRDATVRSFLDDLPGDFLRDLDRVAKQHNFLVLIKIHPLDHLNGRREPTRCDNVRVYSASAWDALGVDLYEALAASDGLVSDLSSVMIDYLVTGKNVGCVRAAQRTYTRGTVFDLRELDEVCIGIDAPADFVKILGPPKYSRSAIEKFVSFEVAEGSGACEQITKQLVPSAQ